MAKKADIRLSVRLRIHRVLMFTALETGENEDSTSERVSGGDDEFTNVEPKVKDDSCREIRDRRILDASPAKCSCCRRRRGPASNGSPISLNVGP